MSVNLGNLYRAIIDDVVRNVQRDFEEHGIDESVLEEMKSSWEMKVSQMQVVNGFSLGDAADGQGGHYHAVGSELGGGPLSSADTNGAMTGHDVVGAMETMCVHVPHDAQ
ncbi:transcription factor IIA, alpha/beta subunit-domain-containing protein [Syncephalis pseudoplumigaleata]|uniref:Transcription initiation factor IIA large subunit n=1 Tax=Syncephalis pseudoplumigaleata TaxID=1712513 RepID=A0A4P9YSW1_9FUNG|nr:transcription factor IIA, alpha/beta subunit-domain-containing protein [Syncephalis pseudoplumigaleata]|eukprot:RKP22967.1 transcription factor IIA, alpha/beta subunit-domain-containing protein [Syncephalis pseudoplumigaleata]